MKYYLIEPEVAGGIGERIKYLFVDGVNFEMCVGDSTEKTPVLVAIGVSESGRRARCRTA